MTLFRNIGMVQGRTKTISVTAGALLLLLFMSVLGCFSLYETIVVDGATRHYLLHVPESLPEGPVPLVLALHQFSDTPRGMRRMTGFDALADREGFIVAYPKGRWRRWRSDQDADGPDHRFLLALMDALGAQYPVDPARFYATGASAGAMMVQALACHTDRLAAIAPVMGSMSQAAREGCVLPKGLPVLVVHGIEDPVIPYEGGRAGGPHAALLLSAEETTAFWAGKAGCDDTPTVTHETISEEGDIFVRRIAYACPEPLEVLLVAVGGCGHSWPGHISCYPARIVGPSVDEPDATEIIWEFFAAHAR